MNSGPLPNGTDSRIIKEPVARVSTDQLTRLENRIVCSPALWWPRWLALSDDVIDAERFDLVMSDIVMAERVDGRCIRPAAGSSLGRRPAESYTAIAYRRYTRGGRGEGVA